MEADREVDDAHPKAGHRLVVTLRAAMMGRKMVNPVRDPGGRLRRTEALDLDPGEPQVVTVMELLIGDMAGFEGIDEGLVVGHRVGWLFGHTRVIRQEVAQWVRES